MFVNRDRTSKIIAEKRIWMGSFNLSNIEYYFLSLFTQMRFKIIFPFDSLISYQFFIICANMNHNEKRQKQFFVLVPQEIL